MTGYVRNDTGNNIATGNVINASDIDGEFDAVVNAFNASTGHTHDGTTAEGAAITKVGPSQALEVTSSALVPKTDNTLDLGSSSFEFKDLYIDGTANIDSLVADTADINAGTIDGVTITTPRITTGLLDTNGNEIVLFTATGSAVNEITVTNAAATGIPSIAATGTDTNISLNFVSKGSGTVRINNAAALFSGGALGTPSSGTLTNATGLPISTGVSGLGTNVATALATNVGTAGAFVTNGGALGTPSSGTLTNCTGLPLTTGVTGDLAFSNLAQGSALSVLGVTGNATADVASIAAGTDHQVLRRSGTSLAFGAVNLAQSAAVTGTLPITNGGTGSTSTQFVNLATNVTGDLPFANLAQGSALSVLGVTGNATADVASIAAGTDHQVLRRSGTSVAFGAINLAQTAAITGTLPVGNGGTGITSLGTGVATWLGTPSSANLASAVTDETGSGALVFGTTPVITGLREKSAAIAASDINLSLGNYFTKTISGTTTFTVSNVATSGDVAAFILVLTNGGSATVNFFSGVTWNAATPPTLTVSGVDILGFFTIDGGTTWRGLVLAQAVA